MLYILLFALFIATSIYIKKSTEFFHKNSVKKAQKRKNKKKKRKKVREEILLQEESNQDKKLYILLTVGLLIRILLAPVIEGYSADMGCFKAWANAAANDLFGFYNTDMFVDYPPLYVYVLFIIGWLVKLFHAESMPWLHVMLVKLPSIFTDVFSAWFLYIMGKNKLYQRDRLFLAGTYLFNPAVLLNSTIWGQVDSFQTFIVIAALYYLSMDKIGHASVLFSAAVLMKPQGIIFLPVLFFYLLKQKNFKNFVIAGIAGIATAVVVVLPFSFSQPPTWIFNLYFNTAAQYPYATLNAFNLFALFGGNFKNDSLTFFIWDYKTWGYLFIVLITLFAAFLMFKRRSKDVVFMASLVLMSGVFIFAHRMHERYLFPVLILSMMVYIYLRDKRFLVLYMIFSGTALINTHWVLLKSFEKIYHLYASDNVLRLISFTNVLAFGYLVKICVNMVGKSTDLQGEVK